ncbi:hypothetical protein BH11CYA1_BH11CYA1_39920 [soil metagenome]
MFANKTLIQTALIASSVSILSSAQPAWSNQWTDMFKTLLLPQTGVTINDSIAARDTQITNRIIDAINANKLSTIDTQNLKTQLDKVKSMEASYRGSHSDGQLDAIETATLNAELSRVELSLNQMLGLPGNYGSTTLGATVSTNFDNYDGTLADLKQRITRNLSSGRLTIDEAKALTYQYNRIVSDRNTFKGDGTLTIDETNTLNQAVDALKRNIMSNNRDNQAWPGIDGQQAAQAKRIDDGIATGRITRGEFERLKAESNRIANQEALARTNGLQLDETLALATSLKDLDQRITVSLNNANVAGSNDNRPDFTLDWSGRAGNRDGRDFDMRQLSVLKKIDDARAGGRIDTTEAADLRADYARLEQLEASYRADGRLSSSELDVLQKGLDAITSDLREKVVSVAVQHPEIDRKQQELKTRINEGVSRGRINRVDSQKLIANLDWIASVEAAFRQSGGTLDKGEADRILADLDRLSAKVDRSNTSPLQDLLTRKNDLQKKIDDNSSNGKISRNTSRNLRRDLDRISLSLAAYSPNANLPQADITRLTADLDRLNSQINSGITYGSVYNPGGRGGYHSGGRGNWDQR